jgi:hypothetical protein
LQFASAQKQTLLYSNVGHDEDLKKYRRIGQRNILVVVLGRTVRVPYFDMINSVQKTNVPKFPLLLETRRSYVGSILDRAALGQVVSEYFGFSCHSAIPLIPSKSSPSMNQGWYNRSKYDCNNSDPGCTLAP